ncbi:autotransporter domain-containing protein [Achromobacter sp. SIMBA_011]|uniref:autotransporter domain-containing protein n=1 Tax=Achromobacter sp. SIMBA_011 TaxID=3085759 RepID=UPI0039796A01
MNHIYRLVWNRRLRVWQAASELASQARAGGISPGPVLPCLPRRHALSAALALALAGTGGAAQADCIRVGLLVQCASPANPVTPSYADASNNLEVTVTGTGSLGVIPPGGGTALSLTGSNVTVSNDGRIDPNPLGVNSAGSTGVFVGNSSAGVTRVTNGMTGTIVGVTPGVGGGSSLPSLLGMAVAVQNGSGGTSYLTNAGMISSRDVDGTVTAAADKAVIAAYGGAKVEFLNDRTGTIVGRVAFAAAGISGEGHSFTNAGTIVGGVSLGQGGNNTFTAVSGSVVFRGSGSSSADLPVAGQPGLAFAPAGTVDGGVGGGNTLVLQNALPSAGTGSGTGGAVTAISGLTYINFQNLRINSGSWILQDSPLVSGGSVTLNGGLATLQHGAMLGLGPISANGGAIAAAGVPGALSMSNDFVLGPGGLTVTGANGMTLSGTLSGAGGLSLTGSGTVILTGAGNHAGGTFVQAGTLQIGNGANSGSLAGDADIAAGAALVFNRSDTIRFDGILRGAGQVRQAGAGTLVLAGENAFAGTTVVDAGTLQVGDGGHRGSLSGNIVNNANLRFDRADDSAYGGAISGAGATTKLGAGTLALTGDSSAYTGATQVAAGTLQVDGKLGGQVLAASGSTLSGSGTLGDVTIASGATLAPGSANLPTGRMNVQGDLTFQPGAVYRVATTPDGLASSVRVAGGANLAGSVLHIGQNGNYAPATVYSILTADNGVQGRFDSVSSNLAFLTPSLAYDSQRVDLVVSLKQVPSDDGGSRPIQFVDAAASGNQRAVARALQSLAPDSALYRHVLNLPDGMPAQAFDALSGEAHASAMSILQGATGAMAQMPLSRLRANLGAGWAPGAPTAQLGRGDAASLPQSNAQPLWTQVFGNWTTLGGDGNAARTTQTDSGVILGGDVVVGAQWRLGGALGYTNSRSRTSDRASSADVDSYSVTLYGGRAFEAGAGRINLSLGAAYTWHDVDTRRSTAAAGLDQTLKASYGASTGQVFGELGYAVPLNDRVTLEPFVGANFSDLRTRGFSESGGDAALRGESGRSRITTTTLGLHARSDFESAGARGAVRGTLGWRHAFGDRNPLSTMSFVQGGDAFSVTGAPVARDAAVVELGVGIDVSKRTTVSALYGGQFGDGNRQNTGSLEVRYRF